MTPIETIIDNIKQEGSFGDVYFDYHSKYRYSRITYFPGWDMFFLYMNKQFISMDPDVYKLLNIIKSG